MSIRLLLSIVFVARVRAQVQFDNSTCGISKGCMFSPPGCDANNNCAKAFSWKVVGDYLNMELAGISSGGSTNYIAVGFSSDNKMGNEPVTDCTIGIHGAATHLSYNYPSPYNQRITNYTAISNDLQLMYSSTNNGRLYCAIRQRIQPSQSNSQVLSLNSTIFILLAVGTATDQALFPHSWTQGSPSNPFVSSRAVSLTDPTMMVSQAKFDSSTCGTGKGCMRSPPGCDPVNNCYEAFSWKVAGDYLNMELAGISSGGSTNYIAVGFSSDNLMGNEPVTDCTFGPQGTATHLSYNPGTSNERITNYTALSNDLQLMNSSTSNGRLYCAIRQRIQPSQSNSQVLSLNRTVFILMSVGTATDQALNMHGYTPYVFVASRTVNLSDPTAYGADSSSKVYVGDPVKTTTTATTATTRPTTTTTTSTMTTTPLRLTTTMTPTSMNSSTPTMTTTTKAMTTTTKACSSLSLCSLIHWSITFVLAISCKSLLST